MLTNIANAVMLAGDISHELTAVSSNQTYILFNLTLCSEKYQSVDVAFEYRLNNLQPWQTDAVLTGDTALASSGNQMFSLPCGNPGVINQFQWQYGANNLAFGAQCDVRIRILPTFTVFSSTPSSGVMETVGGRNEIETLLPYTVIGRDQSGQLMGHDDTSFFVLNGLGTKVLTQTGLTLPIWGQQKRDGNYIVMDGGNGVLYEVNSGGVVRSFTLPNPAVHFAFDDLTNNLISVGPTLGAYEISWGADTPVLLWQNLGIGPFPTGVCYDNQDRSFVVVAFRGAGSYLLIINKVSNAFQTILSITNNSVSLGFNPPFIPVSFNDGSIGLLEQSGQVETYSEDITVHPSLVRAQANSQVGTGQNSLPQYSNFLFVPVQRGDVH